MKRLLIVCLCVCIILSAASCAQEARPDPLDAADVASVTATDSVTSSFLYVIKDEQAIAELVGLYNDLRYTPCGASLSDMLSDDLGGGALYMITYQSRSSDSDTPPACVWLSPRGYVYFSGYEAQEGDDLPVYRLTSAFDEERLKALLEQYNTFT